MLSQNIRLVQSEGGYFNDKISLPIELALFLSTVQQLDLACTHKKKK